MNQREPEYGYNGKMEQDESGAMSNLSKNQGPRRGGSMASQVSQGPHTSVVQGANLKEKRESNESVGVNSKALSA